MEENFFQRLWSHLSDKRQLSMRDRTSDEPHWKVNITPIGLISGIVALLIIVITLLMILMAYTPILEVFPGYKTRSERMHDNLVNNIMRVDSMERLMGRMIEYNDAVTKIINGSTPTLHSTVMTDSIKQETTMTLPTRADSLLRSILEREDGEYSLRNTREANPVAAMFSAPMQGAITRKFDARNSSYAISIMGIDSDRSVVAIENGTVVGVMQSSAGYATIIIQHGEGYTSIYTQLGEILVRKGQTVKSGSVIGRLAEKDDKVMELEFELWRNGTAVDPERYILIK
ncbi:MAG: peptidoglycan DD-metalloendopeptidase family protein [Alistipes sp.]|nr:peptidoglycan DD-metalloendopeptidase family protein [Alistipes sp.]MBO7307113.1 peptidoglycan DD-metalloendopeptidase family protein [Alistipes sp.]